MILKVLPYLAAFAGSLVLTLILTPIVRELNRRLGMVDKPDPRRINTVPIPRGGGVAIILGVGLSYLAFLLVTGRPAMFGIPDAVFAKMFALSLTKRLSPFNAARNAAPSMPEPHSTSPRGTVFSACVPLKIW